MAGWHHRLDRHELGQSPVDGEGQGGLACCSLWSCRVGYDWATEHRGPARFLPPSSRAHAGGMHGVPWSLHPAWAPGERGGRWQLPICSRPRAAGGSPGPSQQGSWSQVVGTACSCRSSSADGSGWGGPHCTQDSLGWQGQDRRARPGSVGAEPSPGARTTRGPGHARAEQVGQRRALPAPLSHSRDCLLGRLYLNMQQVHPGCRQGAGRGLSPPPLADVVAALATHFLCHCENKHTDFRWPLITEHEVLSQPGMAGAERGSPWGHEAATVKATPTWGRTHKPCASSSTGGGHGASPRWLRSF